MQSAYLPKSFFSVIKELTLSFFVLVVLLTMDRCLENMYFFFLYDTGKRYLDIFMSLYLHAHRYFSVLIPVIFLLWLLLNKFKVNYGILLPIAIIYFSYLATSLLTSGYSSRWINKLQYPAIMYLFVTIMCSSKRNAQRFFRVGVDLYIILLLLNTAFTLYPQLFHLFTDWTPDYFISADNLTGFPLFLGALFALLDKKFNSNPVRCYIYIFLFFLNQILIHSTGSVIAAFIFAGYLFIPKINLFFQTKKLSFFVILSIILCIFLIVCAYLYFHSDLAYRILDPLTLIKESLYIRFIIWNGIIALIIKSPIFGYGLGDKAEFFIRPRVFLSYNAHNAYLQTLYEGGIITMATVLFALFIASEKLKKNNNRHLIGIFHIIIFSDLIMMLSAIPAWYTWYPILLIAQIAVCTAEIQEI